MPFYGTAYLWQWDLATHSASSTKNVMYILRQLHRMNYDRKWLGGEADRQSNLWVIGIAAAVIGQSRPSFNTHSVPPSCPTVCVCVCVFNLTIRYFTALTAGCVLINTCVTITEWYMHCMCVCASGAVITHIFVWIFLSGAVITHIFVWIFLCFMYKKHSFITDAL